jgi:hypothetical protein
VAAITQTDLDAAYKEMYDGQEQVNIVYDEFARPFLSRLKKKEDLAGDFYPLPVLYEDVGGGSCTFSTAQTNVAAMEMGVFQIDAADYHRVVQVQAKALRKITDVGAFLTKQKVKVDSMLRALANDIEKSLYRTSDGQLGVISAISTGVITLVTAADAKLFSINDALVVAESTGDNPRADIGYVISKDPEAGTVTVSTSMGGSAGDPTAWEATDILFRQGDYTAASDTKRLSGLDDWLPTADSPGSLFGQARTANRQALAGIYVSNGSKNNIEHSLLNAMAKGGDYFGAAPDLILMDYTLWALLAREKQIEVRRVPRQGKMGVEPMVILGPNGPAECVPASFCQADTAWILTLDTWCLFSAGPCVGIFDDDGNTILRVSDNDALETRAVSYPQLGCDAPGKNIRLALS